MAGLRVTLAASRLYQHWWEGSLGIHSGAIPEHDSNLDDDMTALLHRLLHDRLLHDHSPARRIQLPTRVRASARPLPWDTTLEAPGERLASRIEVEALRSLHPRPITAGR